MFKSAIASKTDVTVFTDADGIICFEYVERKSAAKIKKQRMTKILKYHMKKD